MILKNPIFKKAILFCSILMMSLNLSAQKVAVIYGGQSMFASQLNDIVTSISSTNQFTSVTGFLYTSSASLTQTQLNTFDAVMVLTNGGYNANSGLDVLLKNFVDQGGGVAVFMFANASIPIGPAWNGPNLADSYNVLVPAGQTNGSSSFGTVSLPNHPVLNTPYTINTATWNIGGTFRSTGTVLHPSAYTIAKFIDDGPFLSARENVGPKNARLIDCALFPIDGTTNGKQLYTNVLKWLCGALSFSGNTCLPTNAVNFNLTDANASPIVSYSWNFGDGATATTASPTHTYSASGDFNVEVTIVRQDASTTTYAKTVTIYDLPTTSNAGPDQVLGAGTTSATLAANTPTIGTGKWTFVSGPNTPTITNTSSPTSTVTGLTTGDYVFRWSISNGSCAASTDEVTIAVNPPVINTSGSLAPFVCSTNVSNEQTFTVIGSNLINNITVTAPAGFEVSNTSGSGFASTTTLVQTGGAVNANVYVRLAAGGLANSTQTITISSGATTKTFDVSVATNNSLHFDGTNDYVSINNNNLDNASTELTIEAWLYVNSSLTGIKEIFVRNRNNTTNTVDVSYALRYFSGKLLLHVADGTNYYVLQTDAILPSNTWVHVAGTFKSGTGGILYINGQPVSSTPSSGSQANLTINNSGVQTTIGRYAFTGDAGGGRNYFNGKIDQLRVWNVVRSQTEIQNNMGPSVSGYETGLLAQYNFDQGVAEGNNADISTLNDANAAANNGTLNNFALNGNTSNFVEGYFPQITGNDRLNVGATLQLSSIFPGGAWSSSNTSVATINSSGLVTGVAAGTATITYSICNNSVTKLITVSAVSATDTDGDGIPDDTDTDDDNDGILDADELDCSNTSVSQELNPSPFYFVVWNSFSNGELKGTIDIAGTIVNVTVTNSMNAIISYGGAPYAGTGDWGPAPVSGDGSSSVFWSYTEGEHKFVFDKPVNNPRFFINSLNRTLDLSQPGKILKSNGRFTGTATGSTTSVLVGNEANGTISFTGNMTEVSFTGRAREYYCTFSLGVAALSDFSACQDKDSDNDGTPDRIDLDSDGDGVTDAQEKTDGTSSTDLCSFVTAHQTLSPSATWNTSDCDGDGKDNQTELNQGTDPLVGNTLPVITGPSNSGTTTAATAAKSISENITTVGTYTASETVTWSISGDDVSKFSISASGVLTFNNAPDYENPTDTDTNNTYIVIVTATDAEGGVTTQTLTLTVTDVVENVAPTNITLSRSGIYEANAINDLVGLLSTTDPDAGDTHTYTLVSGSGSIDNGAFSISGNQLKANAIYNYAIKNTYQIRVRTTDAGALYTEKTFTITIHETPVVTGSGNLPGSNQTTPPSNSPTISKGYSSQLNVSGVGILTYSWSPTTGLSDPNIANPIASPTETTTYTVTITNTDGSVTTVSITIVVLEDYNVTPSNILTPNGDGINDGFTIDNLESYPNNQLLIFDKAGRILLSIKNYQNDWDGTINGSVLDKGVYYYLIKFDGAGSKMGYINLIR